MSAYGTMLLLIGVASALTGLAVGIRRPQAWRALRCCQWISVIASAGVLSLLAIAVMRGDPGIAYAVEHHAPAGAPWGYRLAAVWAGQAGGLLLWCAETALVALALSPRAQPRAAAVLFGLQGCLLALATVSTPFAASGPSTAGGLNPLLQHPMMLIHPPMLFLGYALLAVPYAITLGALIDRTPIPWTLQVSPWVLVAWLALTAGNGFGAIWAYKTFGWGGFWAWDPVENTSFVPWVLATATAHCLWLCHRDGRWLRPAAICALGGFLTVLYGSFLARSGILAGASVHAYVGGERLFLWALGGLLAAAGCCAVLVLALRWRHWQWQHRRDTPQVRATALGAGMLMAIAVLVVIGMSLPIFGLIPTTDLYNAVLLPFAAILMFQMVRPAVSTFFCTPRRIAALILGGLPAFGIAIAFVSLGLPQHGGVLSGMQAVFAPSLLLLSVLAVPFVPIALFRRKDTGASVAATFAHGGIILLLFGALIAGYGTSTGQGYIPLGKSGEVAGHTITLLSLSTPSPAINRARIAVDGRFGEIEVEEDRNFTIALRRAWIGNRAWGDLYVVPLVVVPAPTVIRGRQISPGMLVELNVKPGIGLVWLGMWSLAIGLALALMRRVRELRKPSVQEKPAVSAMESARRLAS